MPTIERNPNGTFTPSGAKVAGKIGGENCTDFQVFVQKVSKRKNCSSSCPFFAHCPAMYVSYNSPSKACQFKAVNPELKKQFYRLFFEGRAGLVDEIISAVMRHSTAVHKAAARTLAENPDAAPPRAPAEADARLLMDLYKLLYGSKQDLTITGDLNIEQHDPALLKEVGDLLARKASGVEE